ncbi:hypothetical protein C0J52_27462 [Blattella germanica]|nr:hypothetical protein C0J52_27462 [Blattella germanica]
MTSRRRKEVKSSPTSSSSPSAPSSSSSSAKFSSPPSSPSISSSSSTSAKSASSPSSSSLPSSSPSTPFSTSISVQTTFSAAVANDFMCNSQSMFFLNVENVSVSFKNTPRFPDLKIFIVHLDMDFLITCPRYYLYVHHMSILHVNVVQIIQLFVRCHSEL